MPLVRAEILPGTLDEYDELNDFDHHEADKVIRAAIAELGRVNG